MRVTLAAVTRLFDRCALGGKCELPCMVNRRHLDPAPLRGGVGQAIVPRTPPTGLANPRSFSDPTRLGEWGGGGVNPAVGAGFDGPSLPLPAPKVPQGQGSPPRLRGPRMKATWPGELNEPPRTLPNTPVHGQGGRLIGRRPNADQAREETGQPVGGHSVREGRRPSRRAAARSLLTSLSVT